MSDKNFKVKNGLDANGAVTITQPDTSTIPLIIKANSIASGSNMLEMQRPDGTVRFAIGNDGALTVNSNINFNGGNMTMYPGNSGQTALIVSGQTNQSVANLIVKAATNQSGNLQEWRDQNNNVAVRIGADFALRGIAGGFFGTASGNIVGVNYLGVKGWAAHHIPFVVQGFASQTGDLTRWVDSSANTLAKVDASGSITAVDLTLSGNLTVNGTTTNLNSTNLVIEDKNIILADVTTPTDTTADGAGITIKGATDKTLNWVQSTKSFTTSEPVIINNSSTDVPTLIVKLNTGQTSSIQEWRDHVGNVVAKIGPLYGSNVFQFDPFSYGAGSGYSSILIGGRSITNEQRAAQSKFGVTTGEWVLGALRATDNQVGAFAASTTLPTFVIKGSNSQTANLQEWQNSSGSVLGSINYYGGAAFAGYINFTTNAQGIASGNSYVIRVTDQQNLGLATISFGGGARVIGIANAATVPTSNSSDGGILYAENGALKFRGSGGVSAQFEAYSATDKPLILKGYASQTANLQEWQNSAGTTLAKVDSSGNITAPSYSLSNSLYSLRKTIKKTVGDGTAVPINTTYDLFQFSFSASLQGTFYFQVSIRGSGYGQNLTYSLPVTYVMDWLANGYSGNLFTNNTTWVSLTPQTFSGRHLMVGDDLKLQAKVDANAIYFRLKANAALSSGGGSPYFDVYIQHSEEFAGCSITEYSTTGTDTNSQTTLANFLSSKGGTTELFNPVTIFSNSASNTPLKVKGYASQTANLQEWQSSAGYALAYINKDGNITTAGSVSTNYLTTGYYATIGGLYNSVALTVKGTSGQTNNLQEWQDSTGAVLASISPALNSTVTLKFSNDYSFRINWGNEPILSTESGKLVISSWAADRAALIVKGRTSQSANLQEWQDSSANTLVRVRPAGQLGVGINLITGTNFYVDQTIGTTNINMVIRGGASQTGDLTQWRNSADSTLAKIDSSGNLFAPTLQSTTASTATLTTNGDTGGLLIGTVATGNKGLVINAVASQTANLQEWQVNSSTYLFINNNGALRAGASIAGTGWAINNSIYGASVIPFLIRGAASQTADLQQWQNSSSTVLGKIDAYGTFTFNTGGHAIAGGNAAQIALRIYGASSQTADLQQWINSSNTVMAKVDANGNFSAISKSFDIEHPTKENMRLRYASLEGPENGVYVRGTAVTNIIELPDYWTGLVHEDSITVSLTSVGSAQNIYVEKIENNKVYIGGDLEKAFFTVYGERKDIDKITVEY